MLVSLDASTPVGCDSPCLPVLSLQRWGSSLLCDPTSLTDLRTAADFSVSSTFYLLAHRDALQAPSTLDKTLEASSFLQLQVRGTDGSLETTLLNFLFLKTRKHGEGKV